MNGTGCNMRNKKERVEDIVSICIISVIILLLLIVNVTGSI
jgi:hypothetical protein